VANPDLLALLRTELARAGDPQKTAAMQAYMKSSMPYWGVQTAAQRTITRRLFDAHRIETAEKWREACLTLWRTAEYREERYAAIDLTGCKYYREWQTLDTLPMYEEMIVTGAWVGLRRPNRLRPFRLVAAQISRAHAQQDAAVEPQPQFMEAPQRHPLPAFLQTRNRSGPALRRHRTVAHVERIHLAESHRLGAPPVCVDQSP
jgi:hypothetical protein